MHSKKEHVHAQKKILLILLTVVANLILGICVILSVITAFQNAKKTSFSQNIENVRTLTDASANKVELELIHHTQDIKSYAQYINNYNGVGMTEEEIKQYFADILLGDSNEDYCWQLVDNTLNDVRGNSQGFDAMSLGKEQESEFCYKYQAYQELAVIFKAAGESTLGCVNYTNEFTDASPNPQKSFALTTTVRILERDDESNVLDVKHKTLMLLITSDYINTLLANNNEVDTLSYFDFSNIIIGNEGNYIISNGSFQGTNFMDYIELYNDDFSSEKKSELISKLKKADYSDVLYYENSRGQNCAYTIVPIQNSDWHVLSIVPLNSFHNSYNFNEYFATFGTFFTLLFLVDIVFVMMINIQLRRRTREAQAANEAKSQFLSAMSHDIRTPMNAIIGMTVIADENLNGTTPDVEVLKDCINTIELSGKHLLTLINDILDISKIETGKIVFSPENFSIRENMDKMIEIVEPQIEQKNLELKVHMGEIKHEMVYADELRINQIYLNILSNAIKYTNAGGTITVSLVEEPEAAEPGKCRLVYMVSDTGIGMPPQFLKTIFDRFSRAVDTRVNSTQGTGLGMAICKQLVDLMGGTIDVWSEENVGSTFTVRLDLPVSDVPVIEAKEQKENHDSAERPALSLNILVVEDNDINWKVLSKLLERYEIHADRVSNGQLGVEQIRNSKELYDVVFMDIQMPVMNGYEAAERIRELEDKRKAEIPIYAMTADTYAEDVAKCMEVGMNGHLAKPIETDKLLKILMEISDSLPKQQD